MLLRELFYFNRETAETEQDDLYLAGNDDSALHYDDTRKTKITLRQINELRRAADAHAKDQHDEMEFISRMYATQAAE